MINAKELRIGNLLQCAGSDNYFEVTEEDLKIIDSGSSKAKAILLTEEWFYNFDFIIFNSSNEKGLIVVNKLVNPLKYSIFGREINYVHQLQNLYFALTGKELTL